MGREIKFRQWDSRRKTMYMGIGASSGTWSSFPYCSWEVYPIMQFTGLKDKNGKEIYEGDVLRVFDWGMHTSNNILGTVQVIWDTDDKGWRYSPMLGIDDAYDQFRNVEVIGNIYENPELVNK